MKKTLSTIALALACCLITGQIQAQHNDIEFGYDSGQIFLETGAFTDSSSDAARIFEGDFPTTGIFARFTDDPGFASEVAEGLGVGANDTIGIDLLQSTNFGSYLTYFDPVSNLIVSTDATITLEKGATSLAVTGTSGGSFTIAQADGDGDVHDHIDYFLSDGAEVGAYGLLFELTTDASGVSNSDPIWLVFNYGMDEEVFDSMALPAFGAAAVPEPSSLMVLGALSVGMIGMRRKRQNT